LPEGGQVARHVFAIGDIHGRSDLLYQALKIVRDTGAADHGEKRLIFLGDLIDRGPDSIGVVRQAMACDRWIDTTILPGNHEQMMLAKIMAVQPAHPYDWTNNGGMSVLTEVLNKSSDPDAGAVAIRDIEAAFGKDFIDRMKSAPSHVDDGDLTFVHAGLNPYEPRDKALGRGLMEFDDIWRHWAWVRTEFLEWTRGWRDGRNVVVHGHTVATEYLLDHPASITLALDQTKRHRRIALDVGCGYVGQLAVLEASKDMFRFHLVRDNASLSTVD
jgi:serine/threonine protein phosphatase 1